MIAVWGSFEAAVGKDPGPGQEINPCYYESLTSKRPTCQKVAGELGIRFIPSVGQPPGPAPQKRHLEDEFLVRRSAGQDPETQAQSAFESALSSDDEQYFKTATSTAYAPGPPAATAPASLLSDLMKAQSISSAPPSQSAPPETPTMSPLPTGPPICHHEADPDNDHVVGQCVCTQGSSSTTVAIDKGPNPCPWTALPITSGAAPVPQFTPPPQTGKGPFTETRASEVVVCSSSVVSRSAAVDVTTCASPSTVISALRHKSTPAGPIKIFPRHTFGRRAVENLHERVAEAVPYA